MNTLFVPPCAFLVKPFSQMPHVYLVLSIVMLHTPIQYTVCCVNSLVYWACAMAVVLQAYYSTKVNW